MRNLLLLLSLFVVLIGEAPAIAQKAQEEVTLFDHMTFIDYRGESQISVQKDGSVDMHLPPGWKISYITIDWGKREITGDAPPRAPFNPSWHNYDPSTPTPPAREGEILQLPRWEAR